MGDIIGAIIDKAKKNGKSQLDEWDSKAILKAISIKCVPEFIINDENMLVNAASEMGYPLVLKGIGGDIPHKSELGLVKLNITNLDHLKEAYSDLLKKKHLGIEKIVLQKQIQGKREFVAGIFRDKEFGPIVMFGLGGIYTEALEDVSLKLCPIDEMDAYNCIHEIKAQKLLEDFRGERAVCKEAMVKVLMGLSSLAMEFEDIEEVDINPLIVTPDGDVWAVDALIGLNFKKETRQYPDPVEPSKLDKFFYPKSVVFVGASSQIGKWGHLLPVNVLSGGYSGKVYFVNVKGGKILGQEAYKSLLDIPEPVDLAVVTVPAKFVFDVLYQLAEKNIKHMLLIASGFGETGEEGKIRQKELVALAKKLGITIIGPNTMGLLNPHWNFYCTGTLVKPKPGSAAMVSQSGNMGVQLLSFASEQGIGIRGFCGSGNEAMVCIEDYLEAFLEDKLTSTVMLYVESVKNGRRFFDVAKRVSMKKPVILLKGGETKAGVKAASTHTGAMASDVRVFNAMCKQAGILKVDTPSDLLDLAASFDSLPYPRGNRVIIITLGGGWGVITADLCAKYGLELPELPEELVKEIDKNLPDFWSRTNPIDLVGKWDVELPKMILDNVLKMDICDAVINLGILGRKYFMKNYIAGIEKSDPTYGGDFLKQIGQMVDQYERDFINVTIEMMEKYDKPIFGVRLNTDPDDKTVYEVEGRKYKAVCYNSPEDAVKSCARMYEYFRWRQRG